MNKLAKKLLIVGEVISTSWSDVMLLQTEIKKGNIEIEDVTISDYYKIFYNELDLSDISTWSTYNGLGKSVSNACINLFFSYDTENNKIKILAQIYSGDMLNGHRTKLKFTASLIANVSILYNIKYLIDTAFEYELDQMYDDYLEDKRQEWKNNREKELLTD